MKLSLLKPPHAAEDSTSGGDGGVLRKSFKAAKKGLSLRKVVCICVLLGLASMNVVDGSSTTFSAGILQWFKNFEHAVSKKTAIFYRFFGNNLDPEDVGKGSLCDYGDPSKVKFCKDPPSPKLYGNPNIPVGGGSGGKKSGSGGSSFEMVPAHCLEDPDADGCHMLEKAREMERALNAMNGLRNLNGVSGIPSLNSGYQFGQKDKDKDKGGDKTKSFVTEMPTASQATNSPTKDWCYGYVWL